MDPRIGAKSKRFPFLNRATGARVRGLQDLRQNYISLPTSRLLQSIQCIIF